LDDYSRREGIPSASNPSLHATRDFFLNNKMTDELIAQLRNGIQSIYQTLAALALVNPSLSRIKNDIRFLLVPALLRLASPALRTTQFGIRMMNDGLIPVKAEFGCRFQVVG
jgi:hypothetical protein